MHRSFLGCHGSGYLCTASTELAGDQAWVKHNSRVWLDAHAQSSGKCDVYYWCTFWTTQVRNIVGVRIDHALPNLSSSTYVFWPIKPDGTSDGTAQDVDTRLPKTTVLDDKKELFQGVGKHLLQYSATIGKTRCVIEPGSTPLKDIVVAVTECKPEWLLLTGPNGPRTPQLPLNTVYIYVPNALSDLFDAVDAAAADWTSVLQALGLRFERTDAPCVAVGGACLNVVEGPVKPDACAAQQFGALDDSGVQLAPGTITVGPTWTSASEERRRRTIGHELGHFLGLNHNLCDESKSIMAVPTSCTSAAGMTTTPTANDIWPVRDSVYGDKGRKTCNF